MSKHHSAPSPFEVFLAKFAAAIGFSVLFMFALSAFVNSLDGTDEGHENASHMAAHNTPAENGTEHKGATPHTQASKQASASHGAQKTASASKGTVSLASLLANASVRKGAKIAKKCMACHDFSKGGPNKVGPNLYGVLGRPIAQHKGFHYSPAMKQYAARAGRWDYDNLSTFLHKPKALVKKTKMAFPGLRKVKDLANLIAFLRSNADKPAPLPAF